MNSSLKYKVIKSETQYSEYSAILKALVLSKEKTDDTEDEIELLTLLIEKWDEEHNSFDDVDPIILLKSLMEEAGLKDEDLAEILGARVEAVSEVLNYKRFLSKANITTLSSYFKLSPAAFDRYYKLAD